MGCFPLRHGYISLLFYIEFLDGGEGGIRTLDGLLTHTPLAGARLQPLGHLSMYVPATENQCSLLQRWPSIPSC
jgi:hypothetical protein